MLHGLCNLSVVSCCCNSFGARDVYLSWRFPRYATVSPVSRPQFKAVNSVPSTRPLLEVEFLDLPRPCQSRDTMNPLSCQKSRTGFLGTERSQFFPMPKRYYDDYSDMYLKNNSQTARKQHMSGRRHINNKVEYWQRLIREKGLTPPIYPPSSWYGATYAQVSRFKSSSNGDTWTRQVRHARHGIAIAWISGFAWINARPQSRSAWSAMTGRAELRVNDLGSLPSESLSRCHQFHILGYLWRFVFAKSYLDKFWKLTNTNTAKRHHTIHAVFDCFPQILLTLRTWMGMVSRKWELPMNLSMSRVRRMRVERFPAAYAIETFIFVLPWPWYQGDAWTRSWHHSHDLDVMILVSFVTWDHKENKRTIAMRTWPACSIAEGWNPTKCWEIKRNCPTKKSSEIKAATPSPNAQRSLKDNERYGFGTGPLMSRAIHVL